MSTTVDERVVSMQFDNRNFEQNATTTMSTLDKLKQKLNLSGASKGLAEVEAAAKSCNLNPICNAAETVGIKFDAMSIMAKRALENIVDSAYAAGKKIVSALTIDPVKSGLQEYETQINAVQTILANTQSKGSTLADVNAALDELNKYADLTIYNFTEMTRNIGTFTAAGVGLETSVNAIKGIANLAAVSGSTSQQASTAMYQLSQALASGTVKLMDWNSVVNAGMGGQVFQDALKETARVHGIAIDSMIKEQGSFRETLSEGWLTSEILTETLQKFTLTTEGLTEAEIEANREMLRAKGYTEDQIEEIFKLGNTATEAATKVKTFSQMWDVLKEAAQSGWSQTWRIVIGDFEEAKALFTPLTDLFTGIIQRMSDWRNNILEFALAFASPWESIKEKLSGITSTVDKVTSSVSSVTDALAYYQDVVNKVWRGDYNNWGDSPDRRDLLTAAGYNPQVVQELVNKGYQYKLTMDDVNAAQKKFGVTLSSTSDEVENTTSSIAELTDEQLKQAGLTEDEISMYRALEDEADRLGISVTTLADRMSKFEGRTVLIKSLENIGGTILDIARVFKEAWKEIFDVPTVGELAVKLYMLIDSFHKLSARLRITDKETGKLNETGEKLKRVFKGVIAVFDVVRTIAGGALSVAFSVLKAILGEFDMDILDIAANIGDAIVEFDNWFKSIFDIQGLIGAVIPYIVEAATAVAGWIESIKNSDAFKSFKEKVEETTIAVGDWIEGIKDAENIAQYLGSGLGKGLGTVIKTILDTVKGLFSSIASIFNGGFDSVFSSDLLGKIKDFLQPVIDFFSSFVNSLAETVGIDLSWFDEIAQKIKDLGSTISGTGSFQSFISSISNAASAVKDWFAGLKETDDLGSYIVTGLINGIKNGITTAVSAIVSLGIALWEGFCNFFNMHSPSVLMMTAGAMIIAGLIIGIVKMIPGLSEIVGEMTSVGEFTISGFIDGIKNKLGGVWDTLSEFGSGVIDFIKNLDFGKIFAAAGSIGIITFAYSISKAFTSLAGVFDSVEDILKSVDKVIDAFAGSIKRIGKAVSNSLNAMAIKNIAVAIAILVGSIIALAYVAKDDSVNLAAAVGVVFSLAAILAGLFIAISKISEAENTTVVDLGKVTAGIFAIAGAIMIMAIAAKMIGGMDKNELIKAGAGITVLAGVMVGLMAATKLMARTSRGAVSSSVYDTGKMLMSMAAAMLIMIVAAKMIASMEWYEMAKAGVGLVVLAGILVGLIAATKLIARTEKGNIGTGIEHIGKMLLKIAVAIIVLVVAAKMIASMEWSEMAKAGVGLLALAGIMVGLIAATKLMATTGRSGASQNIEHLGKTLLSIAAAMIILTVAAKIIAGMEWSEMAKAGVGLVALAGIIVGLTAATKLAGGKDLKGVASTILAMAVAIGVMAAAAVLLSLINFGDLMKGILAIGLLGGVISVMVMATKNAGDCKGDLMAMAVAIGVIAAAIAVLSFIDPISLASATIALGTLMGMFALISSQAGKTRGCMGPLIVMTAAVAVMAGMIVLLSKLTDTGEAIQAAAALSYLMVAMSMSLAILSKVGNNVGGALAGVIALLALAVPLIAFVGILALMQNIENATANALVLGTFAAAMTLLLAVLTIIGSFAVAALLGVLSLTAMAVPLLAFVGILALMNNVQNAEANAKLLIKLMTVMTGLMVMLGIVAPLAILGVTAMTALTVLITAIGVLATAVGALMEKFPALQSFLDTGIDVLVQLASGIGRMIGSFITGFAGEVLTILPMIGISLSAFMVGVTPFINGVKTVDESVVEGAGYLAGAILAITAADLIANIADFLGGSNSLADLGTELSNFMTNVQPFIDGASTIDPGVMDGVKALANVILTLTAADILESLTSWFTGGSSIADFGSQLVPFGEAMKSFSDTVVGIDEEAVMAAANAGKIMAEMQSSLVGTGGVVQWFMGEKDMATFGTQMVAFGSAIVDFSSTVAGNINEEAITSAANAGAIMTEMQSNLVGTGGVVQWFTGEKDMATFGSQLFAYGVAIKNFSSTVAGNINEEAISAASSAGSIMLEMQKSLEPMGGVVQWFTGERDMATFGSQIVAFGGAIVAFSETVAGNINEEAITAAANAGLLLADLQEAIPEDKWFDGKVPIDDFGKSISKFGEYIVEYSENVVGIDTELINSSIASANSLVNLAKSIADIDTDSIDNFESVKKIGKTLGKYSEEIEDVDASSISSSATAANKLKNVLIGLAGVDPSSASNFNVTPIGTNIKSYSDKVADLNVSAINSSISCANRLISLINSTAGIDTSGVNMFKGAVESLANTNFSGFAETFNESAAQFANVGTSIITNIANGIKSKQGSLRSTAITMVTSIANAFKSKQSSFSQIGSALITRLASGMASKRSYVASVASSIASSAASSSKGAFMSFYYAGGYLVDGFAAGITANTWKATARAAAMARAAYQAAKDELDVNSPSKVFRKLGTSVPEGFAQGIDKLGGMVKNSSVSMANTAINGTKNAISRIADIIDSNIDTQPTIRPVLDLSDIRSGAGEIGSMFNITPSVGVMTNVGAISSMMAYRQNEVTNGDVVSAIKDLGRKIGDVSGNTYNVNGITYDDGSNVSNAIRDLVRAARIERRM